MTVRRLALPPALLLGALLVWPAARVAGRHLAEPAAALALPATLWWHTALVVATATLIASALGTALAAWIIQIRSPVLRGAALLAGAFPLAVPMYLHGMASWQVAVALGLYAEQAAAGPLTDLLVVGLVQGLRLASLVCLCVLAGWRALDARWLEAGLLAGPRGFVRRRLLWPLLAPFAAFGALLAAVVSAGDVGVPLLFQVRSVIALRLWDAHYRALDPAAAWRAMLGPALLLAAAVGCLLPALWRRAAPLVTARRDPAHLPRPAASRWLLAPGGLAALALVNGSLLHLLRQVTSIALLRETFHANAGAITATAATALGAAAVALVAGLALAPWVARGRAAAAIVLTVSLALFAVPGFLWAAASVSWWSQPGWRGSLCDSGAVRWLVLGGRLAAIPALLVGLALARLGAGQFEAARLAGLSSAQTARGVVWPALRRPLWLAYALAVLAVAGDLDAAILMDLPGRTTLVVALCNRLHISPRSPEVAMMAAVILATAAALLAAPALLAAGGRLWRSRAG